MYMIMSSYRGGEIQHKENNIMQERKRYIYRFLGKFPKSELGKYPILDLKTSKIDFFDQHIAPS